MVFEPAFEEIDREAAGLPDLGGDGPAPEPEVGAPEADDATDHDATDHDATDDEATASVEGEVAAAGAEVEEDDLPAYGEE